MLTKLSQLTGNLLLFESTNHLRWKWLNIIVCLFFYHKKKEGTTIMSKLRTVLSHARFENIFFLLFNWINGTNKYLNQILFTKKNKIQKFSLIPMNCSINSQVVTYYERIDIYPISSIFSSIELKSVEHNFKNKLFVIDLHIYRFYRLLQSRRWGRQVFGHNLFKLIYSKVFLLIDFCIIFSLVIDGNMITL